MKNIAKRLAALLIGLLILSGETMTALADTGYTYNYDWWENVQYSPDAYDVVGVYGTAELGLETKLSSPQGMFVYEDKVYICDTGNNRIIELRRSDVDSFEVTRIIDSFNGAEPATFLEPTDISVSWDGYFYIADKGNGRILKLDQDLNYIMEFSKPVDATIAEDASFQPEKIAVDDAGRMYCVAVNVNQGLIKYESDGSFAGFVGATKVTYNWADYIWKRLSTKEQREQLASFVPTEYDNLYMDKDGFVYVTTTNATQSDLYYGSADAVRRLNMMGDDILVRNGNFNIIGDLQFEGGTSGYTGASRLVDITAMDNDVYIAVDQLRGRLFAYDDQGKLLFAFGGNGNMEGCFKRPVAIDHMGHDLLVLDSLDSTITLFTTTEFGSLVYRAMEEFQAGKYYESGKTWEEVLKRNGNYDLAYIGIGRALLRQKKYKEAMEYFELKWDEDNYSKAYKQYRKEWVEDNILWMGGTLILLLCVPVLAGRFKDLRNELDTADIFDGPVGGVRKEKKVKVRDKRSYLGTLKYSLYVITHPFDGFWDLTHEKRGSMAAATTILVLTMISRVMKLQYTSFIFNKVYWEDVNIFLYLSSILVPLALWCVGNWGLTTLFDGKGRLDHIYMATCYAMTPYPLIQFPLIIFSNLVTVEERQFYDVVGIISLVWAAALVLAAMIQIHEYTVKKSLLFTVATLFAMLVIVFILLLFFSMISQGLSYFISVAREIIFRM